MVGRFVGGIAVGWMAISFTSVCTLSAEVGGAGVCGGLVTLGLTVSMACLVVLLVVVVGVGCWVLCRGLGGCL